MDSKVFRSSFLARVRRPEQSDALLRFGELLAELVDGGERGDGSHRAAGPEIGLRGALLDLGQVIDAVVHVADSTEPEGANQRETRLKLAALDLLPALQLAAHRVQSALQ